MNTKKNRQLFVKLMNAELSKIAYKNTSENEYLINTIHGDLRVHLREEDDQKNYYCLHSQFKESTTEEMQKIGIGQWSGKWNFYQQEQNPKDAANYIMEQIQNILIKN
jgi:hypothetical protein